MLENSCKIGIIFGKSAFVSTVLFDNNINYPHMVVLWYFCTKSAT